MFTFKSYVYNVTSYINVMRSIKCNPYAGKINIYIYINTYWPREIDGNFKMEIICPRV